jgi:hypothetical protein
MASTSNKNTPGNYQEEQRAFKQQLQYSTNKEYAFAKNTYKSGFGLNPGQLPDTELAKNPNDIESFLFGIGSTNLVKPQKPVTAEVRNIPQLSMLDRRVPLILPKDLVLEGNQRPYPIPK